MSISERLKQALNANGWTIKEASESCGIAYRSMQNYLRGEREPNAEALGALSVQLGISADWLLTGRGKMLLSAEVTEPCLPISPREQALLEMFKTLSEDDQREIFRGAEEKKRLAELEKRVEELSSALADGKKLA